MAHLRSPSVSRGFSSFLWGLFLGAFIWLGLLSVGVTGATSFIIGAVAGAAIFLFVLAYGGDEPRTLRRQPARARSLSQAEEQQTRQIGSEKLS